MPPVPSDDLRNLNDDSYRPLFRSLSCSMHVETDRSHLSYALRFMISKPCRPGMLPGHLSLQVGLRPSVPCLAQLSSPQLNSGTASNCFSGVPGWNRRGKEFRRHESRATKTPPHRIQLWYLKPNLRQHSLRLLSPLPMHLLPLLR